jgi:DNA-binding CsgD family transcriptional regulator
VFVTLKPLFGLSRQNFRAKTLAEPCLGACRFPFPLTHEARMFYPEMPFLRCDNAKDAAKFSRDPAIVMAIAIEIAKVTEGIVRVTMSQIADEENNAEWELVQQVEDQRSADEFERLEVRDTLRVLLERTKLSLRERQVVNLILQGDNFNEIARKLKVSRSFVGYTFKRAAKKLHRTADKLNIKP